MNTCKKCGHGLRILMLCPRKASQEFINLNYAVS